MIFSARLKSQEGNLSISQLKLSDAGRYTLFASNRDANATLNFVLVVKGSLEILLHSVVSFRNDNLIGTAFKKLDIMFSTTKSACLSEQRNLQPDMDKSETQSSFR